MRSDLDGLLTRAEEALAELRRRLDDEDGYAPPQTSPPPDVTPFDAIDWARRQRPEWEPRGRLFYRLAREGGTVTFERWKELGHECGWQGGRGMNGFFAGNPSVVVRNDEEVILTERGWAGARYWHRRYGEDGDDAV